MALFGLFGKNKSQAEGGDSKIQANAMPLLPNEIYEAAALELKDIIAPSALKIEPKAINLGDKTART